ncbi:MAG: hypothetical protein MRZ79_02510 [Bacteroidia bacterium]|nr:hypothetical protein [Bacteroidia bacterium]
MNTIPATVVDEITEELFFLENELVFEQMVNDLGEEQPFVFTYLMTIGENDFNEEERELMLVLGVIIWKIMSKGKDGLPTVSEQELDKVEQSNMPLLEKLAGDESGFVSSARNLAVGYNQPEILNYIIDSVIAEEEEGEVREINQGIMIIFLKIVIDCLDG